MNTTYLSVGQKVNLYPLLFISQKRVVTPPNASIPSIVSGMGKYFGKTMTISKVVNDRYLRFSEDNGFFSWSIYWVREYNENYLEKELFEI